MRAEALELVAGVGQHRAAAGDDHRPLRALQQIGDGGHRRGRRLGRGEGRQRRLAGLERLGRLGLDVDGQHEHHGPALDHRALVGALGVVGGGGGALDAVGGRAHGLDQPGLVDAEVGGQRRRRRLAGEHEHGRAALHRLGEAGHRVGEPRALVHAADPDAAAHARVPVRHADRPVLAAGGVEAGAAAAQRVGDHEVAAAQHPEGVADAGGGQRLAHDIGHALRPLDGGGHLTPSSPGLRPPHRAADPTCGLSPASSRCLPPPRCGQC